MINDDDSMRVSVLNNYPEDSEYMKNVDDNITNETQRK